MRLGLDIDGTITANPEFFHSLTYFFKKLPDTKIYVITFRDYEKWQLITKAQLGKAGIYYDELIMGNDTRVPQWKADIIIRKKINIVFEDDLDVLNLVPAVTRFQVLPKGSYLTP